MRAILVLAIFLADCAVAPDGTTLDRVTWTMYRVDLPATRPLTPGYSDAARTLAFNRDAEACLDEFHQADRGQPLRGLWERQRQALWPCLRAKGWRWE